MTTNKQNEEILQRLTRVETKLDQLITETIPHILKLQDEQLKNLHGRMTKLEQSYTWLIRTVVALVIGGIVQIVIMNIK